jgi:predicted NUDIX family NTP pyrophosphohydrolase
MVVHSAALLLHRQRSGVLEVFLGHMGGPFWARKDAGAWSVPKGEFDPSTEDAAAAARREFAEEIGMAWEGPLAHLGDFPQRSGKVLVVHEARAEAPVEYVTSNEFTIQWPPGSGTLRSFPEIDRAGWFGVPEARDKVVKGQVPVLDALTARLGPSA